MLPALANDAQYMARFEREARMLGAQNDPNIATVYRIEQGALEVGQARRRTTGRGIKNSRVPEATG